MTLNLLAAPALRAPVWIDPGASLCTAARRMAEAGTSSILVGAPGQLVSILTERDVSRAVARGDGPATLVEDLAVPAPVTVPAHVTVREAAEVMLDEGARHLVVRDGDRALGVVSLRDIVAALVDVPHDPGAASARAVVALAAHCTVSHPEHWWG